VQDFSIRKSLADGIARFDVAIVLTSDWPGISDRTTVRFSDARKVRYGRESDGIDFGAYFRLRVDDVSRDGWEGITFKVHDIESDCNLSLYCGNVEIEGSEG
jgi:hypothetical protein